MINDGMVATCKLYFKIGKAAKYQTGESGLELKLSNYSIFFIVLLGIYLKGRIHLAKLA